MTAKINYWLSWDSSSSSSSSEFPALSLGFTILGEIFAYMTIFLSNHRGSHIPSLWMVRAECVFVASIHPSRTWWMSGFFNPCEGMHVCTDLTSVYTLIRKSFVGTESEAMLTPREKKNPLYRRLRGWLNPQSGLPFSRGFADFRENEVSESAKKKLIREKKIRPNLFLKRQLKLTQTASKLQPRADDRIVHLVFALRYEISRDQPVAIVFWVKMPRSDFVRRHEAAFRDLRIFLVGALHNAAVNSTHYQLSYSGSHAIPTSLISVPSTGGLSWYKKVLVVTPQTIPCPVVVVGWLLNVPATG